MRSLKKLFHIDREQYEKEYLRRFSDENTIHLNFSIGSSTAFFCQTVEIFQTLLSIERTDKQIAKLCYDLPGVAFDQFKQRCLISEIILTNNIEGVHSTRKEISSILKSLEKQNKRRRFVGLVRKYAVMDSAIPIRTPQDIRKIYDDIFFDEIKDADPDNLPDGKIFRAGSVSVYNSEQEEIHRGILPEKNIISSMKKALELLNDETVDMIIRIAVFHYLFGYIHPFYDGNGRVSRFISSYLLSNELNSLIGYRLSSTIKEKIKQYYEAFQICNSPMNKGDLTPFIEMFVIILNISEKQLYDALKERVDNLAYYRGKIAALIPNDTKSGQDNNLLGIYDLLIQATLFSDVGISTKELEKYTKLTYNTVVKYLSRIEPKLLVKNKQGKACCYTLDLDTLAQIK